MQKLTYKKWFSENGEIKGIIFQREEDKKFEISFQGNLDLYFSFNSLNDDKENFNFIIGKDNYKVWSIFDSLYQKLITGNLYSFTQEDKDRIIFLAEIFEDYHEKLREEENSINEINHNLKSRYEYKSLVNNGVITWRSDEYSEDIAPFFKIERVGESYLISFGIPERPDRRLDMEERDIFWSFEDLKNISVRLRNSGSRYDPCNIVFMDAFNSLMALENDNQIHIEEYLIDKQLEKGISLERILRR